MFLNMYQCQKALENLSCYRSFVFHNKEICNRFDVEFIDYHMKKGMVGCDIDYILENIQNKFALIRSNVCHIEKYRQTIQTTFDLILSPSM